MTLLGLGPVPGTDMATAADVIQGEAGNALHIPQLPERGLGSDVVGRTLALMPGLHADPGPRAWRLSARPQLASRRAADAMARDLDTLQETWGESQETVKIQLLGPISLAAALELPGGRRAITDRGAVQDLTATLKAAIALHQADVARRFSARVSVQLDEPALADVLTGNLAGTSDFDTIPALPAERARAVLEDFRADYLAATVDWEVARAAGTLLVPAGTNLSAPRDLDGAGEHLSRGGRLGIAVWPGNQGTGVNTPADEDPDAAPRASAIALARWFDEMGLDRALLATHVDVYPDPRALFPQNAVNTERNTPAAAASASLRIAVAYRHAAAVARILERDAGDL